MLQRTTNRYPFAARPLPGGAAGIAANALFILVLVLLITSGGAG